mgnify:CR=1 FL=1
MKHKKIIILPVILALLLWSCGPTYPVDETSTLYPQAQLVDRVLNYSETRDEMHCEVKVNYDSSFTELSAFISAEGFDEDTFTLVLNDAGLLGDALAGDGIYSRNTEMNRISSIDGSLVAVYKLFNSSQLLKSARDSIALSANLPPQITEVTMPDTIVRPRTGSKSLLISLTVDDPNGVHDVTSAYFQVKNNSSGLWSSDYAMNDEGESGDEVAGDAIFSTGLQITSANAAVTNFFRFRVKDSAANFSEWSLDSVVVR